jgi:hypothetical protein
MQNSEIGDFKTMMFACAEIYGLTLSTPYLDLFWAALARFPIQDVQKAIEKHLMTGLRMPVPAALINIIRGGSPEEHAAMAWPNALRLLGEYMDDRVTLLPDGAAAMAAADLARALNWNGDEAKFQVAFFKAQYEKYYSMGHGDHPGVYEGKRIHDEHLEGYRRQKPVIFDYLWPPEERHRHARTIEIFKAGKAIRFKPAANGLPASANGNGNGASVKVARLTEIVRDISAGKTKF